MKKWIRRLWGFRSSTPWKSVLAILYYVICLGYLIIAMITPPLVQAGAYDAFIVKISSLIIFVWMISPAIFLSDTRLRSLLPFFKDKQRMRSLVGLMIVFLFFALLFGMSEQLHTQEYQERFSQYMEELYGITEMGSDAGQ